jgi:hypothetical protein
MADRKEEEAQYSIDARSLVVAGVASHDFLVLRDGEGRALAELHGLATDRKTGQGIAIGTDEAQHSLRIWHFAHDSSYAKSIGAQADGSTFIAEGQDHKTMLVADKQEVLSRWNAAVAAKEPLNALDLNYPNYGFRMSGDTVNSNSAYRTLSEIMGVPVHDFPGRLEPGLDNRMIDQKRIEQMRTHGHPVLNEPSIKRGGDYAPIEERVPRPGPESSPAAQAPSSGDRRTQFDARDPSHPGHGNYASIRESLAGNMQNAQHLDSVTAATYREMAANPLIRQVDYAGVHNGYAVVSYAPHGLGREPMFNAYTDIGQAQQQPAEENLGRAHAITEARAQAETQALPPSEQARDGPALSIGARTA